MPGVMHTQQSWDMRIQTETLPCLNALSDDILMEVFSYLDVEDILSLRQVSKLYYNLTHQGIIWKNFLKRIGPNAPQLPPSYRHSPQFLTSFEAERLVTRAVSLHINWVSPNPHPVSHNSFQIHRLIQSMVVLPGGKYMVASVCNLAATHYSLVVFALDHRIGGVVPLAETPVKQKAYNMQARYMNIDGTPSIVIGYIRRKTSPRHSNAGVNPSIYNSIWENPRKPIDPPVPLQYVCTCVQISLDSLDALSNPRLVPGSHAFFAFAASQPPPFRLLSVLRSTSELGAIDLAVIDGVPTMAVVKGFETVVLKELTGRGFISTLCCAREELYSSNHHTICNLRILPHQGQILTIRAIKLAEGPAVPRPGAPPVLAPEVITLAMFSLPEPGNNIIQTRLADESISFRADDVEGIQITSLNDYESCLSAVDGVTHPPLSILYRSGGGTKLHELIIEPTPRGFLPKTQLLKPHYFLGNLVTGNDHRISWETEKERGPCRAFVLPGSQRSLVYVTRSRDIEESLGIRGLYSYLPSSDGTRAYRSAKEERLQSVLRNPLQSRTGVMCKFDMSPDLRASLREGVKAIAWDESIGRVFYVKPDDPQIHVVDFAKAPIQAPNGQRWPLPLADERMLEL
ncbi:hypothetical protein PAXRUDRAFT_35081 [Paxillus rubicundulus Ve08.2h10]|uniref:F-box domain-containing protein n=1 Tax=Paxillus rubicundulus Ve08.2h10 TaxID=930991 RepID=A0A0D0DXK1_9AGAM|nr:hypothetical protein PAXRUDRAFT_35081 [Paxillus rubicundulus Ve08.2h10]